MIAHGFMRNVRLSLQRLNDPTLTITDADGASNVRNYLDVVYMYNSPLEGEGGGGPPLMEAFSSAYSAAFS